MQTGAADPVLFLKNIDQQVDTAGGKLTMGRVIGDETGWSTLRYYDTFTGSVSTQWSNDEDCAHSMGDGLTDNALPAGTGSVQITGFTCIWFRTGRCVR